MSETRNWKLGLYLAFALLQCSCAKKERGTPISYIIAGDTAGNYVHHVVIGSHSITNFNLDVNKDLFSDLNFKYTFNHYDPVLYSEYYYVSATNNDQQVYICVDTKNHPVMLNKDDTINDNLNWASSTNLILYGDGENGSPGNSHSFSVGNWQNKPSGYLGVKIIRNSQTYWGWVFIEGVTSQNYSIRDLGYIDY